MLFDWVVLRDVPRPWWLKGRAVQNYVPTIEVLATVQAPDLGAAQVLAANLAPETRVISALAWRESQADEGRARPEHRAIVVDRRVAAHG